VTLIGSNLTGPDRSPILRRSVMPQPQQQHSPVRQHFVSRVVSRSDCRLCCITEHALVRDRAPRYSGLSSDPLTSAAARIPRALGEAHRADDRFAAAMGIFATGRAVRNRTAEHLRLTARHPPVQVGSAVQVRGQPSQPRRAALTPTVHLSRWSAPCHGGGYVRERSARRLRPGVSLYDENGVPAVAPCLGSTATITPAGPLGPRLSDANRPNRALRLGSPVPRALGDSGARADTAQVRPPSQCRRGNRDRR
jgi:hypothetical protein